MGALLLRVEEDLDRRKHLSRLVTCCVVAEEVKGDADADRVDNGVLGRPPFDEDPWRLCCWNWSTYDVGRSYVFDGVGSIVDDTIRRGVVPHCTCKTRCPRCCYNS